MQQAEPKWIGILRTAAARSSLRKLETQLGYSRTTIGLVLNGKYQRDLSKIKTRVLERLKAMPKPRAARPPQLKQLDPALHKVMRKLAVVGAEKHVAEILGIDAKRIWPLIRGTDAQGAADVIAQLQDLPFSVREQAHQ